jgi:hypothetical protein
MHWECEFTEWISAKRLVGEPERAIAISAKTITTNHAMRSPLFSKKQWPPAIYASEAAGDCKHRATTRQIDSVLLPGVQ